LYICAHIYYTYIYSKLDHACSLVWKCKQIIHPLKKTHLKSCLKIIICHIFHPLLLLLLLAGTPLACSEAVVLKAEASLSLLSRSHLYDRWYTWNITRMFICVCVGWFIKKIHVHIHHIHLLLIDNIYLYAVSVSCLSAICYVTCFFAHQSLSHQDHQQRQGEGSCLRTRKKKQIIAQTLKLRLKLYYY
jgi:hypothetical protein